MLKTLPFFYFLPVQNNVTSFSKNFVSFQHRPEYVSYLSLAEVLNEICLSAELNFVKTSVLYLKSLRDYVAGLASPGCIRLNQTEP